MGRSIAVFDVNDPDGDGISNTEEKVLGTNPSKADTDGDGLSDGAESKIHHTNPLKAGIPMGTLPWMGTRSRQEPVPPTLQTPRQWSWKPGRCKSIISGNP